MVMTEWTGRAEVDVRLVRVYLLRQNLLAHTHSRFYDPTTP